MKNMAAVIDEENQRRMERFLIRIDRLERRIEVLEARLQPNKDE